MGTLSKNFSSYEFTCRCGCGFNEVRPELVDKLQELRYACGFAIRITSGCRCALHNQAAGGVVDSSHLTGLAADIPVESVDRRFILLGHALRIFPRVIIYPAHLHVDVDPDKPQRICQWSD